MQNVILVLLLLLSPFQDQDEKGWENGKITDIKPYKGDEILGYWLIPKGIIIKVEMDKSGSYKGTIKGGHYDGELIEKENELYGKLLFKKLKFFQDENIWKGGTIYPPSGNISATLSIEEVNEKKIHAVGQKLFFSKETVWKKIRK